MNMNYKKAKGCGEIMTIVRWFNANLQERKGTGPSN